MKTRLNRFKQDYKLKKGLMHKQGLNIKIFKIHLELSEKTWMLKELPM